MFNTIKNWLAKHNFYLQQPIKVQSPVRRGKISVFQSRDLEIDREKKLKEEEAEKNPPHPVN